MNRAPTDADPAGAQFIAPAGSFASTGLGGEVVWLLDLGLVEYGAAYELQRRLQAERDADRVPDLLLLVEHPPVITLGRRGSREHVFLSDDELAARGVAIFETNRGGLVTYHGPGQVVGYPIARLRPLAGDAPTYVWRLEETIIRTLAEHGIQARRDAGNRGVFAEGGKIAAIGVAVTHGVTMHGFALNVRPDLDHFTLIDPCGIGDLGVTSIERLRSTPADLDAVRTSLAQNFGVVFDRTVQPAPWPLWELIASWGLLEPSNPLPKSDRFTPEIGAVRYNISGAPERVYSIFATILCCSALARERVVPEQHHYEERNHDVDGPTP